ncbi:MAG: hypothetical protein ACK4RK_17080 [Gemmataceae bacterium]
MVRMTLWGGLVAALLASPAIGAENVPGQEVKLPLDPKQRVAEVRAKLAKPSEHTVSFDPNTPLKDALEFLSDLEDVAILLDSTAFRAAGCEGIEDSPVALPRLKQVRLGKILDLLLAQLPTPATYFVNGDGIVEVTIPSLRNPADWVAVERYVVPTIELECKERPLAEALNSLAEQTSISILLDPSVGEAARSPITAHLRRVPLDTAVRLLADMANLKSVPLDNVIYVTTPKKAKVLHKEQGQRDGLGVGGTVFRGL